MTDLFDLFERLTSLMRIWHREHPLLADVQPVQLSALEYLARCNRYSDTPLAVTDASRLSHRGQYAGVVAAFGGLLVAQVAWIFWLSGRLHIG